MSHQFSPEAYEWLANYHGSIDATALLLAYEAGRAQPRTTLTKDDLARNVTTAIRDAVRRGQIPPNSLRGIA